MALDSYFFCPGGRDKKIRFCCPDKLKELNQIDSLLTGGQTAACLTFIEQLEKKYSDCACLDSAKCLVLRTLERWDEALEVAQKFASREPKNIVAKTELAINQAAMQMNAESIATLVDAIELNEKGQLNQTILFAMLAVGRCLLEDGFIVSAVAIAKQLQSYMPDNREAAELLNLCIASPDYPLFLKEQNVEQKCSDNFPEKTAFYEAILCLKTGYWKKGLQQLESLLPLGQNWPSLYRIVAIVRLWFNDFKGCVELLKQFIAELSQSNPDHEDIVDAQTLLLYLDHPRLFRHNEGLVLEQTDFFGDIIDIDLWTYPVNNFDAVLEQLLSMPTLDVIGDETTISRQDEEHPAPKKIFAILNQPFPDVGETATFENTPYFQGALSLFGAETNRPARIELNPIPIYKDLVLDFIQNKLGTLLGEPSQKTLAQNSWTDIKAVRRFHYRSFEIPSEEKEFELYEKYLETVFVNDWIQHSFKNLNDQSPEIAAQNPEYRSKIQAFLNILEMRIHPRLAEKIINNIRLRLNLESPKAIPLPDELSKANIQTLISETPVWRWHRIDYSKFPTSELFPLLQMVHFLRDEKSIFKLASELLNRPMSAMKQKERSAAFSLLISYYLDYEAFDDALLCIAKAKNESEELKQSDAQWNLSELIVYGQKKDMRRFSDIMQHLTTEHKKEPEIMQQLQSLMIRWGIINPDGTVHRMSSSGPNQPSFSASNANIAESKPSELWTPESEKSSSQSGTSKLWIPD